MSGGMQNRRTTAGFASGFMSITALLGVVAALTTGLGPTEPSSKAAPRTQIGEVR